MEISWDCFGQGGCPNFNLREHLLELLSKVFFFPLIKQLWSFLGIHSGLISGIYSPIPESVDVQVPYMKWCSSCI